MPKFVVDEFEAYLRCGILEHGLAHLACNRCGHSMVVAFSCKRRGFCSSCIGRRMSDVAKLVASTYTQVRQSTVERRNDRARARLCFARQHEALEPACSRST